MTSPSLKSYRPSVHPFVPTIIVLSVCLVIGLFTTGCALAIDWQLTDTYGVIYKPFNPFSVMTMAMSLSATLLLAFVGYGLLCVARAIEQGPSRL